MDQYRYLCASKWNWRLASAYWERPCPVLLSEQCCLSPVWESTLWSRPKEIHLQLRSIDDYGPCLDFVLVCHFILQDVVSFSQQYKVMIFQLVPLTPFISNYLFFFFFYYDHRDLCFKQGRRSMLIILLRRNAGKLVHSQPCTKSA